MREQLTYAERPGPEPATVSLSLRERIRNPGQTFLMTLSFSLTAAMACAWVQIRGQSSLSAPASYLDPWLVDVIALSASLFLVVEGVIRQIQNRDLAPSRQLTRAIRVAIGCGVLTIHLIQFMHK